MTPDEFARRKDYPCPVCGYHGVGCICNEVADAEPALEIKENELIILLPDNAPLTREEQTEDFHNEPNYDNLDSEDRHYLDSVIRLFLAGMGDTIDLEALNHHLQIRSLERGLNRIREAVDNYDERDQN